MAQTKITEIRELSSEELQGRLRDLNLLLDLGSVRLFQSAPHWFSPNPELRFYSTDGK